MEELGPASLWEARWPMAVSLRGPANAGARGTGGAALGASGDGREGGVHMWVPGGLLISDEVGACQVVAYDRGVALVSSASRAAEGGGWGWSRDSRGY